MHLMPMASLDPEDRKTPKSPFFELYSSLAVMNTYLKVALLGMSVVLVALAMVVLRLSASVQSEKVHVVGIDPEGRPHALPPEALDYHPQERELKYFLTEFVVHHYGRMRATFKENYARSLYFLESGLAAGLVESNRKSKMIETFMAGQGDENDVKITSVSIEDMRTSPYHATVDFEKIFYSPDHQESRHEAFTASIQFIVKDRVSNEYIPVNPLGLTITYFREDQAFTR